MEINRPIAIAVAIFVILGFGFYVVAPKYREFRNLQLEIGKKEAELRGKTKYFSDLTKLKESLVGYEENIKKIESALPLEPSIPSLIYFFQDKSDETGLIFQGASFLRTIPLGGSGEIKESFLNLELFGSYPAFRNFLSALEKSSRLIEVENVSINSENETQETFPFRMLIKVYSY